MNKLNLIGVQVLMMFVGAFILNLVLGWVSDPPIISQEGIYFGAGVTMLANIIRRLRNPHQSDKQETE